MADLDETIKKAKEKEERKKFKRGIRPDHYVNGSIKPIGDNNNQELSLSNELQKKHQVDIDQTLNLSINNIEDQIALSIYPAIPDCLIEQTQSNYGAITEQSGSKVIANQEQSGSKLIAKVVANQEQSGSKLIAKVVANQEQSGSKVVAEPIAKVIANQEQSGSKLIAIISFSKLSGIQRNIALFIYEECKRLRSKITSEINLTDLCVVTKTDVNTSKNAINRLIQKCVTRRYEYKDGRSGWTRYELAENIYQDIRDRELNGRTIDNWEQSSSKVVAEPVAKLVADSFSGNCINSSSENLNPNTNTKQPEPDKSNLPSDWLEIDFTDLVKQNVHFGRAHLKQWYERKYCNAQEAQESIWHFAHFFANTSEGERPISPIKYLMGSMSRTKYFSRPDGYVSPEEIALERRSKDMKKKNENLRRIHEELFNESFETWFNAQTGAQIQELVPHFAGLDAKKATLREMFRDQHWLAVRDNSGIDVTQLKIQGQKSEKSKTKAEPKKEPELSTEEIRRMADQQFGANPAENQSSFDHYEENLETEFENEL